MTKDVVMLCVYIRCSRSHSSCHQFHLIICYFYQDQVSQSITSTGRAARTGIYIQSSERGRQMIDTARAVDDDNKTDVEVVGDKIPKISTTNMSSPTITFRSSDMIPHLAKVLMVKDKFCVLPQPGLIIQRK